MEWITYRTLCTAAPRFLRIYDIVRIMLLKVFYDIYPVIFFQRISVFYNAPVKNTLLKKTKTKKLSFSISLYRLYYNPTRGHNF